MLGELEKKVKLEEKSNFKAIVFLLKLKNFQTRRTNFGNRGKF